MSGLPQVTDPLRLHVHTRVSREASQRLALAQVGWIGQSGGVYALDDQPMDAREPGSFQPLYIAVGAWEDLGDGHYGIKD